MGKFGKRSIREHGLSHREPDVETLDLHKLPADEAEDKIDAFVNDCVMRGVTHVKIVHGNGKGVLKRTTEQWLRSTPQLVESYRSFGPGFDVELIDTGHYQRRG